MVNPNNFYTVQGWMVTELGLRGNELAAYAIIYGFSQDGASKFQGSLTYVAEWLGCDRSTARRVLSRLAEKGLVAKVMAGDGITPNSYTTLPLVKNGECETPLEVGAKCPQGRGKMPLGVGAKCPQGWGQNAPGGRGKMPPNNYNNNNINNYKEREETSAAASPSPASAPAPQKVKHKYGEYKNVLLTDEELDKLKADYPQDWQQRIDRLSEYIESSGKRYKNHYATIKAWARRDKAAPLPRQYRGSGTLPADMEVGPNGVVIDRSTPDDLPW